MTEHERLMDIAIEEAKAGAAMREQPFGAVVTIEGEVVARCHSLKVSTSDTTAHSERLAIAMATRKLRRRSLPQAVFYATCEPCPMCLGAILNAGIPTLVLGARNCDVARFSKLAFNFKDYSCERFAGMVGRDLTVVEGVRSCECIALYAGAAVELTR
jgi:tRNA(adenine34) deaminase